MSIDRQIVWLRPNRPALLFASIVPLSFGSLMGWLAVQSAGWLRWVSMPLAMAFVAAAVALALQAGRPRIALHGSQLMLYLTWGAPLAVPLSIVECMFLGRPETQQSLGHTSRMVSLVIRLAEAATEFRQRKLRPALGRWEDGYITIHGAWCEPLTLELARGLNEKLRQAQRQLATTNPCHYS